jgi:hypothetical protein
MQEGGMADNDAKKNHSSEKFEEHASARQSSPASVQPNLPPTQPHEARLSGAKVKEQHRLLKENVEQGKEERHPDLPAGLHSTGSFTGENENKK